MAGLNVAIRCTYQFPKVFLHPKRSKLHPWMTRDCNCACRKTFRAEVSWAERKRHARHTVHCILFKHLPIPTWVPESFPCYMKKSVKHDCDEGGESVQERTYYRYHTLVEPTTRRSLLLNFLPVLYPEAKDTKCCLRVFGVPVSQNESDT